MRPWIVGAERSAVSLVGMHEKPIETRIDLLEHEVRSQGQTLSQVVKTLGDIRDLIVKQPQATTISEKVKLVGAAVALTMGTMTLADKWLESRLAPDRQLVNLVAKHTEDYPVLNYRVGELEKRFSVSPAIAAR
jgi:hypothetical protein